MKTTRKYLFRGLPELPEAHGFDLEVIGNIHHNKELIKK